MKKIDFLFIKFYYIKVNIYKKEFDTNEQC